MALAAALMLVSGPAQAKPPSAFAAKLIVPADSPVRLQRVDDEDAQAEFAGRLVLTGTFRYGCAEDCEGPLQPQDLQLDFAPDPQLAARLPHWRGYTTRPVIEIDNSPAFAAKAIPTATMRKLQSGRLKHVTGRIAITVDKFSTGLACDAAWYQARFVDLAGPADLRPTDLAGDAGCN